MTLIGESDGVRHFHVGKGQAIVTATDGSNNVSSAVCKCSDRRPGYRIGHSEGRGRSDLRAQPECVYLSSKGPSRLFPGRFAMMAALPLAA